MSSKEIVQDLLRIADICKDEADGFSTASKLAKSTEVKYELKRLANQRKKFLNQLKLEAIRFGHRIQPVNSLVGIMNRILLNAKAKFSKRTDEAAVVTSLDEARTAAEVYDEILKKPSLPARLMEKLSNQRTIVRETIDLLHALRRRIIRKEQQISEMVH